MENLRVGIMNNNCDVLRVWGSTSSGGKFVKELKFLPYEYNGSSLDQLEQFIMECKYEALYPPPKGLIPPE